MRECPPSPSSSRSPVHPPSSPSPPPPTPLCPPTHPTPHPTHTTPYSPPYSPPPIPLLPPQELKDHVIIAGYGRTGQLIAALLSEHLIPFVALDVNTDCVAKGKVGRVGASWVR